MNLESTVSIARKNTNSLRTTVPEGIVAFLDIENGDKLEWIMKTKGKERSVMVKVK